VSLVPLESSISMELVLEYPLACDHVGTTRALNEVPCPVGHEGRVLLLHSHAPVRIGEGGSNRRRDRREGNSSGEVLGGLSKPISPARRHRVRVHDRRDGHRIVGEDSRYQARLVEVQVESKEQGQPRAAVGTPGSGGRTVRRAVQPGELQPEPESSVPRMARLAKLGTPGPREARPKSPVPRVARLETPGPRVARPVLVLAEAAGSPRGRCDQQPRRARAVSGYLHRDGFR